MLHIRCSKLAVVIALAIPMIPAGAAAQLIHFTTIHLNDPRIVGARDIGLGTTSIDTSYSLFVGITSADIGQTLVATRDTIGTEGWQRINGVLSNGKTDEIATAALTLWLDNGGSSIGKSCLFFSNFDCTDPVERGIFTYDSPWVPPNGIDLGDHHVDEFRLTVHSIDPFAWSLAFYGSTGHVPEPGASGLLLIGLSGMLFHRRHHTPALRRQ